MGPYQIQGKKETINDKRDINKRRNKKKKKGELKRVQTKGTGYDVTK